MRRYFGIVPLFLIPFLFTGCSHSWFEGPSRNPDETNEISRVVITYSEKMRFEKNLELEDSVIAYDDKINRIRLDYSCMDSLHIWDARALLVDTVEGFLNKINSNQRIAGSLSQSSIKPEDLEIYIRFISFYTKYVDPFSVGMVCMRDGMVTYYASDTENCETDCWHRRTESYAQSKSFTASKREGEMLYQGKKNEDSLPAIFGKEYFTPIEAAQRK